MCRGDMGMWKILLAEFPKAQRGSLRSWRSAGNSFEQYHLVLECSRREKWDFWPECSWDCWPECQEHMCLRSASRNKTAPPAEPLLDAPEASDSDFLSLSAHPHMTRVLIVDLGLPSKC